MSVRHIHAKPGQHVVVHRGYRSNNVRRRSTGSLWLTLVYIAGGIAAIAVIGFLLYTVLGWLLPLLPLAVFGYFVCLAMGSRRRGRR